MSGTTVLSRAAALALLIMLLIAEAGHAATLQEPTRIHGVVTDAATGRPLSHARILLVGDSSGVLTDLDGRFRTRPVNPGIYSMKVTRIGYRPLRVDSIEVVSGELKKLTIALEAAPFSLGAVSVQGAARSVASETGLLSEQQNAASVGDGISSEAISRTPDSDAAQALLRVTGLSVVEDKVVVRGLAERYSTALLNGVEVASPEPERKFVPLNVFAASLLESIVATKTATPDLPADFAGGAVDIRTKEFPERFIFSLGTSQGYRGRSTFKPFPRMPRGGRDFLGFNGMGRGFSFQPGEDLERFGESLSDVWTPGSVRAVPQAGYDLALGGSREFGGDILGFVFSGSYGGGRQYEPDRYDAEGEGPSRITEAVERVSVSGVANFALRLGSNHKFGFKNFYSGSSDESVLFSAGADVGEGASRNYQVSFVEQYLTQTQLTADHLLPWLWHSRIQWKLSYGRAHRADLDNRQLRYFDVGDGYTLTNRRLQFRGTNRLIDDSYSVSADWSIPVSLRGAQDALLKTGIAYRRKDRRFEASYLELQVGADFDPERLRLPPELLLSPENIGPGLLEYRPISNLLLPYQGTDRVTAGYLMADFDLLPRLRVVGGIRAESWYAELLEGDATAPYPPKDETRLLWSSNLTWTLSRSTNLRFAAYQTLARPDLRELSKGVYPGYPPGAPQKSGNPNLRSTRINNADVRFEIYPRAEELLALSAFRKTFTYPIVTTYRDAAGVLVKPDNGDQATSLGAELELRKHLTFVSGRLRDMLATINVTVIRSRVTMPVALGIYDPDLQFQGQSPYLINLGLTYSPRRGPLSATLLFNRFGDRIVRYAAAGITQAEPGPNVVEKARSTLDAKLKATIRRNVTLSLSGKNLLGTSSDRTFDRAILGGQAPPLLARTMEGVSFSLGLTYAP